LAAIRHHGPALEMLGVTPERSPARERLIARRERACGVAFPAAVVEWFGLDDAHRLFEDNSNQDRLEELDELGDPAETRQGYLRVAWENQGVVAFYVRLDEGDDPPVYDNNDEFGQEDLAQVSWNPVSVSFSNFVFDMVSIGRLHALFPRMWVATKGPAPGAAGLEALARRLRPGPVTHTAEVEVHRFFGPHEYVTVRWEPEGEADWHVEADSRPALDALRADLEPLVTLPPLPESPRPRRRRPGLLARLLRR
jgi:hypothetical protein